MSRFDRRVRVGLSGTGFVASRLAALLLARHAEFDITTVLTRRSLAKSVSFAPDALLTNDHNVLAERSDLIVECSGTVGGAALVALAARDAGIPLITLNAEFQLTLGAFFSGTMRIAEAQGDQPGSLAALDAEVRSMGFQPLVYASQKGFLNLNPAAADMAYWAQRQGISIPSTVSFTDGTKVQIEQALVANGLGATLASPGLVGPEADDLAEGGEALARIARRLGAPIADYVLQPGGKGEVFIVASHDAPPADLSYYKLGDGPNYMITRPYHLGHFEIPITIEQMLEGRKALLTAGEKQVHSVAAIAKRDLSVGTWIDRAIGGFDFRGEALSVADQPRHVPIGLMERCRLRNSVQAGQWVEWGDVEFEDAVALDIARRLYPLDETPAVECGAPRSGRCAPAFASGRRPGGD